MSARAFAAQLRDTVVDLKAKGTLTIGCDTLIAYLDEVLKSPSAEITEPDLARYRAELELWVERHRNSHSASLELFRSVIESGQNAIRSSFLLNGGAAVAVLAFIGHLAEHEPSKVSVFSESLLFFVIGVFTIAVTSGVTYLSQWLYAAEDGDWKERAGRWLNIAAIVIGLSSYGWFILGMCRAYTSFKDFVH
ncbi:MAG: hypothetical protein ABFC67_07565 [Mizugakiibacter sp.]|uniref:hypothetical protein n=1 Tax=Mizugakiibacter sp. TaxID=1972610 RepID=UPI0031BD490B|nr:hypothetical protein [Xanthomonadaceae bacterium]